MRLLPFRVVLPPAVSYDAPTLEVEGRRFGPGDQVTGWNYITDATVRGRLTIDPAKVMAQSGLSPDDGMRRLLAVLRVDCPSTGRRYLWAKPVGPEQMTVDVAVEVPAGETAKDLEVRYEVVLDGPDGPAGDNRAAYLKGSRLFVGDDLYRFRLEGDSALFPVEAVKFRGGEFPVGSAWLVKFQAEDLNAPFLGSVRLFVNRDHPAAEALLGAESTLAQPIMIRDILLQMLMSVALETGEDAVDEFDEGSTGAALEELCATYLDVTLRGAVGLMRSDPGRVFALLQAGTDFLKEKK
ncbi:hypothetical protein [Acidipropionibacterium acidipropionici]|uniref:hypothetical protein n=1 Tax=Acidipropionibacterium acidipropionici TaxID=1748 RepID=UPI00110B97A4|nr:hypothetical protein [Acidipropionibacterium acidipropionici]QCV94187.1 hypothetical protein FEZ30_01920 [Acidipropionibacterium acidipropionici]